MCACVFLRCWVCRWPLTFRDALPISASSPYVSLCLFFSYKDIGHNQTKTHSIKNDFILIWWHLWRPYFQIRLIHGSWRLGLSIFLVLIETIQPIATANTFANRNIMWMETIQILHPNMENLVRPMTMRSKYWLKLEILFFILWKQFEILKPHLKYAFSHETSFM